MIIQVSTNAKTHANHPPKKRNTRAKITVIRKEVKKTWLKSVCLALLKKLRAIFKKIAIIMSIMR
jgi:hypothetical protein